MNNIPNRIKQPAECCTYCGKSYKIKKNLNKHILLCEVIYRSKTQKKVFIIEEDEEIPSQKQMYNIIVELSLKVNKLEKKIDEMNKWVDKKRKKINVLDWLNNNKNPNYNFNELLLKIENYELNIEINYIFDNNIFNILHEIILDIINEFNLKEESPLFASSQKQNTLFIYNKITDQNNKNIWHELISNDLIKLLNKIHNKVIKNLYTWKQINLEKVFESDKISEQYNKALMKIMNIDFKNELTYNKMKTLFYNNLKMDMKAYVEYEFEF